MKAVTDGDEKQLQDLLKQAQADIAKFNAAAKAVAKKKANVTTTQSAPTPATATATPPAAPTKPTLTPAASLKKEYKTIDDVRDTIEDINESLKWFSANRLERITIETETDEDCNGSTFGNGRILLQPDIQELVTSALDKITKGNSDEITVSEAKAIATYWHEITHNRFTGSWESWNTDETQTDYMETANEYIARETMDEFYNALGVEMPASAESFKITRDNTSYEPWVATLRELIKWLNCDVSEFDRILKDKLFNGDYRELKEGIADALYESGGKNMVYDAGEKMQKDIRQEDCQSMIRKAVELYKSIKQIQNDYPNLRPRET